MADSTVFEQLYKTLNPAQRQAVDTVEGPVLVVAGPGTGKTHILTLRIANILRQTQANPSNILALTFTDSAARTMRRRLAGIVGEQVARDVTISTFHGFCELVLGRYPERFPDHASRRLMGDVEQVLLMREAIETADYGTDQPQLRPPKAPYTYLDDLLRLYDQFAREGVSLDAYALWGENERTRIQEDPTNLRKRSSSGGDAGTLTQAGQEKLERMDKVDETVRVLRQYDALKESRGTYDFTDMLRLVIERIGADESLRADLQEQYQYVLADEHQDANALQHRLLELFALQQDGTLDEFPNIFAVGDEKQAIYRFQGADLTQFRTFTELFPRATVITLTSSFRSYQEVLDTAHKVIAESLGDGADAQKLTAERGSTPTSGSSGTVSGDESGPHAVSLIVGADPLDERAKITELVSHLIDAGTPAHEIAVISRKNETADLIAAQLEARGLPVLRAGDVSLTSRPLVHAILSLMHYVADPTNLGALRRALLAPWWQENAAPIPVADILLLLRTTRDSELLGALQGRYPGLAGFLATGIEKSTAQTPIECFSWLFAESGARGYLLSHADHLDDIALVRQLIQHLEEAARVTEGSTFRDAMALFSRASEHGMSPVKTSVTEREGFVTVITAHKSKGMEFQHVIIPDLTENGWEKGGKAAMIPSPFDTKQALDDVRRLFYVALTRAKDHAYLTYPKESKDGRDRNMSVLMPTNIRVQEVNTDADARLPLLHQTVSAPEILTRLAKQYLTEDGLAPTALNTYLKSPAEFFATCILRIKEPPQGPMILGNAVHGAIASFLNGTPAETAASEIDRCFRTSLLPRDAVFNSLLREAHELFAAYVADPLPAGKPLAIEKKYTMKRVVDGIEVTIQGKIDAVFETPNGTCVIDFKTGSQVSAKNEDYIRQLMLYTHLLEAHEQGNKTPEAHVDCTSLIALSKDGPKEVPVPLTPEARQHVLDEIDEVVHELLTGQWRRSAEPTEYDDLLKLFA